MAGKDREILVWRQRLGFIIQEWQQTGRDDGFLLRGSLLDEAKLWLSRRSNDLTPAEKEFINASLSLQHRERANRAIGRFELLVDSSGSELEKQHAHSVGEREAERLAKDLPFLARPGTWRVEINVIPVAAAQAHSQRSRLPHSPINTVLPLLSAAAPADLTGDHPDDSSRDVEAAQKLDDQTFALLKSFQLQGASGLALELISPQLDGISDPNAHYRNTNPRHWWGEIQVGLARCRLMRTVGSQEWAELARAVHCEAIAAGYSRDAAFACELLNGQVRPRNVLMFL